MKLLLIQVFAILTFIQLSLSAQVKNNLSKDVLITPKTILKSIFNNGKYDDYTETVNWKPTVEEKKSLIFTWADSLFYSSVDTVLYLKNGKILNAICIVRTEPSDYPAFGIATFEYEENKWNLNNVKKFVISASKYETSFKILKMSPDIFTLATEFTHSKMGYSATYLKIFSLDNDSNYNFKEIFNVRIAEDDEGAREEKYSQFNYKRKIIISPSNAIGVYGKITVKTFGKIQKKSVNSVEQYFFDREIDYFIKTQQFIHNTSSLR